MSEDLLFTVKDRAAWLTINREERGNSISQEMISSFVEHLDRIDSDPEIRAVCITGSGDKAFCSGADLAATLSLEGEQRLAGPRGYAELLKKMAAYHKPLVARVNGPCLAGGLGLMLSCHIVIARNDVYFSTPEVKVGIFPMMVGALLFRDLGRKKAMDMVLSGRRISAAEAEGMGLVSRLVEPEHLDREVGELLGRLAAQSLMGNRIGLRAFHAMSDLPLEQAVDHLCEELVRVIGTEDAREGMRAFVEKRKPRFTGQ